MAPQILGFDVAWPKLWHKNGVFDQNLGCSGHFDVASEKWAPVALKIFYRYASFSPWGGGGDLGDVSTVGYSQHLPSEKVGGDFQTHRHRLVAGNEVWS